MNNSSSESSQNKRTVFSKIRNNAGETISETLVSLLISALALVMLAGAISAASTIVNRSRDRLNNYYDANQEEYGVVMMSESTETGSYSISVTEENGDSTNTPLVSGESINCYINNAFSNKPVVAFKK